MSQRTRNRTVLAAALVLGAAGAADAAPGSDQRAGAVDAPAFLAALRAGDVETVERAIRADPARARTRDPKGTSALLVALYHGKPAIVKVLADAGVELDIFEAA